MVPIEMEDIIAKVEHSLAVEGMTMTEEEKENLRKIGRGELTYNELINQYVAEAKQCVALNSSLLEDAIDALELQRAIDEDDGERVSWEDIKEKRR